MKRPDRDTLEILTLCSITGAGLAVHIFRLDLVVVGFALGVPLTATWIVIGRQRGIDRCARRYTPGSKRGLCEAVAGVRLASWLLPARDRARCLDEWIDHLEEAARNGRSALGLAAGIVIRDLAPTAARAIARSARRQVSRR